MLNTKVQEIRVTSVFTYLLLFTNLEGHIMLRHAILILQTVYF
jgi:hypothetical protein